MKTAEVVKSYFDYESATKEIFLSDAPYIYLYQINDPFERTVELQKLKARGRELGVNNVQTLWESFERSMRNTVNAAGEELTNFDGQKASLKTSWECGNNGIYKDGDIACYHPIMPIERIINVDSGLEKIKLAYRPNHAWRTVIVDKSILSSNHKIQQLADYGISVSSETSRHLVSYLQEMEALNYDQIPTTKAVSRLGWIEDSGEFMPYSDSVQFDGDVAFERFFKSVHSKGSHEVWADTIRKIQRRDVACRIVMAASFLSPLMGTLGILPAFVHLWASKSSTGKTLLLMAAASVWADPHPGTYVQSFNTTAVASERIAGTANSLPVLMDELQLARNQWGALNFDVYKLSQGYGKSRGTKTGGIDRMETWRNMFITSGESPIVDIAAGQGAFARVIEVELERILFEFEEGNPIANTLRDNYGHGGEIFINEIKSRGEDWIKNRYNEKVQELKDDNQDLQDKHLMIGGGLLVASELADQCLFNDPEFGVLTASELAPFLATRENTSIELRALDLIKSWIAANSSRFSEGGKPSQLGYIEGNYTYVIKTELNDLLKNHGMSSRSVLSGLAQRGLILTEQRGNEKVVRNSLRRTVNGQQVYVVAFRNDDEDETILPY